MKEEVFSANPKVTVEAKPEAAAKASIGSKLQTSAEELAAGNQEFINELKERGILQFRFPRDRRCFVPHPIVMDLDHMFEGARRTIRDSLIKLHKSNATTTVADFDDARADEISTILATGCNLITVMKLRAIALTDVPSRHTAEGLRKPIPNSDLPIPLPFAYAIQELGIVDIIDLTRELKLAPCIPECGYRFDWTWNPDAYHGAVEYATSIGMRFGKVNTNVKVGSAWWLFTQSYAEGVFQLECPYPETNFTDIMVVLHSLYMHGELLDPSNAIADLTGAPETGDFGIMLQSPHIGINSNSFLACSDTTSDV